MCGRYTLYTETYDWAAQGVAWPLEEDFDWTPSYNIPPGVLAPVVPNLARPAITLYQWGLVPHWAKDSTIGNRLINARAETLAQKPAFSRSFSQRRCLVLADGFYEWQTQGRRKTPFFIRTRSHNLMGLAGLWEQWIAPDGEKLKSFTIVTAPPNELIAPIHNRMPIILAPEAYQQWLAPGLQPVEALSKLLVPYPSQELEAYTVSALVNNPANNTAECINHLNE